MLLHNPFNQSLFPEPAKLTWQVEKPSVEDVSPIKNGDFPVGEGCSFLAFLRLFWSHTTGSRYDIYGRRCSLRCYVFFSRRVLDWNMLLMKEILHHQGCIKPCTWDIYYGIIQPVSRISFTKCMALFVGFIPHPWSILSTARLSPTAVKTARLKRGLKFKSWNLNA